MNFARVLLAVLAASVPFASGCGPEGRTVAESDEPTRDVPNREPANGVANAGEVPVTGASEAGYHTAPAPTVTTTEGRYPPPQEFSVAPVKAPTPILVKCRSRYCPGHSNGSERCPVYCSDGPECPGHTSPPYCPRYCDYRDCPGNHRWSDDRCMFRCGAPGCPRHDDARDRCWGYYPSLPPGTTFPWDRAAKRVAEAEAEAERTQRKLEEMDRWLGRK